MNILRFLIFEETLKVFHAYNQPAILSRPAFPGIYMFE